MGIEKLTSVTTVGRNFTDDNFTIGVLKPEGRDLTPSEILLKAVMSALGTEDAEKAKEFIGKYNLKPAENIPSKRTNDGQQIYEFPVDAEFYNKVEDFKKNLETVKQNNLQPSTQPLKSPFENNLLANYQANRVKQKSLPQVAIPERLRPAYQNYLKEANQNDSLENRHKFIKAAKSNPEFLAKYQPVFKRDAKFESARQKQAEIERQTQIQAQKINQGYGLRYGKTAPKTKFSPETEKEYQIARLVYQATDSEEFRQAFSAGKLNNAGRIFNARYAPQIEKNLGERNPLLYGNYRSQNAPRDLSPDKIAYKRFSPEELSMLQSIEVQGKNNGGKPLFAPATIADAEVLKRGFDGKSGTYTYSTAGLKDLPDARREVFRRVLISAGYTEDAANAYLDRMVNEKGSVSYNWSGNSIYDTNKDKVVQAEEEAAFNKDEQNLIGTFTLSSEEREKVSVADALARGDKKEAFEILANNYRLRREREFEKNKTGNLLKDGFDALALHREMNADIDKLADKIFNGTEDFRLTENPFQTASNKTADFLEKDARNFIESVPFLKDLSEENKQRIVDYRIGLARGTAQLFTMVDGAMRFIPDLVEDGLLYSMKQAGMDVSAYEAGVKKIRETKAEMFRAFTGMNTKSLQLREYVYDTKQNLNIRTSVFDLPSGARSIGEMIPQMLPQLALGAATGGMSIEAQIAINAAVGAAMEGGQSYALSNNRSQAAFDAMMGAINGGMIPLGNKLGFTGDMSLQIGWTAVSGKLRGLDDNQIIDQMIKQVGGAIAFNTGTKLNAELAKLVGKAELSFDAAKRVFGEQVLKSIKEGGIKYAENLQAVANQIGAKIKVEGGKLIVEVPQKLKKGFESVKAIIGDPASRLNVSIRNLPLSKRPTILPDADGGFIIGKGDAQIKLSGEQVKLLSNAQLKEFTRIVGLAEKSKQFENLMTDNRKPVRQIRSKMFDMMARIEAANPKMEGAFEPLWEKIARVQENADGGHSIARHGSDATDTDLTTRLRTGATRDGRYSPTDASTRFNSFKDWVLTRDAAFREIENANPGLDFSKPWNPSLDRSYKTTLEYNRAIDDGFVGVRDGTETPAVNPYTGNTSNNQFFYRNYSPISGVTRSTTTIRWNAVNNKWEVAQHFPVGRRWNDVTKSYMPPPGTSSTTVTQTTLP